MKKIPVRRTIAEAYGFTFGHLERVIGVIWLPIIVLTICDYFVAGPYLTASANLMDGGDMSQAGPMFVRQFLYGFVRLGFVSVIGAALIREILKPLDRPLYIRMSLGRAELKLTAAFVALYMLLFAALFACMILGLLLGSLINLPAINAVLAPGQRAIVFGGLIAVILCPLFVYVALRLSFLVAPAAVIDGSLGLERSWQLTKGNVWRIIAVSLAVAIPVAVVGAILQMAVLGPDAFLTSLGMAGNKAASAKHSAEEIRQVAANLPMLKGLEFVLAPFTYGLAFAAPAFAFKALTADPEPSADAGH